MRWSMFIVSFLQNEYISFIVVQSFKYFEEKKKSRGRTRGSITKKLLQKSFCMWRSRMKMTITMMTIRMNQREKEENIWEQVLVNNHKRLQKCLLKLRQNT